MLDWSWQRICLLECGPEQSKANVQKRSTTTSYTRTTGHTTNMPQVLRRSMSKAGSAWTINCTIIDNFTNHHSQNSGCRRSYPGHLLLPRDIQHDRFRQATTRTLIATSGEEWSVDENLGCSVLVLVGCSWVTSMTSLGEDVHDRAKTATSTRLSGGSYNRT